MSAVESPVVPLVGCTPTVVPSAPFAKSGPPATGRSSRTFKPRRGRLTKAESEAVERWLPDYLLVPTPTVLDARNLVVDIGFGNGETTLALAAEYPEWQVLAIDVHTPGFGVLVRGLHDGDVRNVRIIDADALDVLTWMCAPGSVAVINVAFPDPWPKAGQQHRRLVDPRFAELISTRLKTGGIFCFASDWVPYAEQVRDVFAARHDFEQTATWATRPHTKFEQRGIKAGRVITDLAYRRRD